MATGVGEIQGSQLDIGASGAYRYVNIYQVDFNESDGKSKVYYRYGTYVNYGDFWGATFTSEGSCSDQYTVDGVGIYDPHWGDATCNFDGSLSFWEKCYFTSYSAGYVQSVVSFTWYPTLPKYTITYNANGGSGAPSAISRTWSKTNQTLSSSAPSRTGYTFKGWATTSGGSVAYSKGGSIPWGSANKTQTLYAVWQENTWTVSYNGNGATSGSTASQTKYYTQNLTLRSNGFTRTGFTFKHWNVKADDSGTNYYAAGGTFSTNANTTLYAIWNRTVSYNLNGASGTTPSSQTAVATSAITLASSQSRSGYAFKRWNTKSDDTGTGYNAGASYPAGTASATLYAIWNPIITYKANGASGSDQTQTKTYGTTATLKASDTYTRSGFEFKEWNTNSSGTGTSYPAGASFTSNTATTLYAIWNATLSYNANGGSGAPGSQTAKATENITISSTVPTRAGYTFLGWGTTSGATTPTYQPSGTYAASGGNKTLYAVWRCDIRLTNISCSLVDSNGYADTLGKYVKVSVAYDATTSGHALTSIVMTLDHSGISDSQTKTTNLGTSGTATFTFGPYAYNKFDPHGGYHVGTIDATNTDGTISASVDLSTTSYKSPVIGSLSTFRTEEEGGVYVAADDGTSLGIEVSYTVAKTRSQTSPQSIKVTVKNSSGTTVATRTFSSISGTSGVARLDVYHTSSYTSDVLVNDELISVEDQYSVTVVLSDAYSNVVTSEKAQSTDTVTVAYFTMDFLGDSHLYNLTTDSSVVSGKTYYTRSGYGTFENPYVYTKVTSPVAGSLSSYYEANGAKPGHGIGLGKPSTREGLDVGMETFFGEQVSFVDSTALPQQSNTAATMYPLAINDFSDGGTAHYMTRPDFLTWLQALPLSGGTMTGKIERKSTTLDLTAADNGLSSYWNPVFYHIKDKNDNALGYIQWYAATSGYTYMQIDARNMGTGSNVTNYLQLRVNNDGSRVVNVSEAAPWRTALGLGSIATESTSTFLKRQPASTTDLPQDTSTSSGYPLVLSDSFANSGVVSYMTAANFRTLIGAPSLSDGNKYQNYTQYIKFTGVDSSKSDNDISSNVSKGWEMLDKNDKFISYLETTAGTDGSIQLSLVARNLGTGSNVNNGLYIKVANDGTRSVSVSETAPWRSGFGVHYANATSLYDNSTGTYGTVTLSSSAANFSMLEIFYKNGSTCLQSVRVWSPNGKNVSLASTSIGKDSVDFWTMWYMRNVTISGTSISAYSNGGYSQGRAFSYESHGDVVSVSANEVAIVKVLGWKA